MIGIELRFLSGRFHANPWQHAHNEGVPEWPPSPWRILRALTSAAYADGAAPNDVLPLVEKLSALPRYRLPRAVDAHTRHYMPDTEDAYHKKAKVFDAFVAVDGGAGDPRPLTVAWSVELAPLERALLEQLCRRVSYLGRAESWVDASVVDEVDGGPWSCWPDEQEHGGAATTLLALAPAVARAVWANGQPSPLATKTSRKTRDVPRTLWDVLTFDGERYRAEGWSSVPGTRLVRYVFEEPPFRRSVVPQEGRRIQTRPTVARYAIRSAVLPCLGEALAVCEHLRISAMAQSKRISGDARPVFSGHVQDRPSNHGHAMYLATSVSAANAARGLVDHLIVSARDGFDADDVLALQGIRRLWRRSGHDLDLVLVGLGTATDYGGSSAPRAPVLAESSAWRSLTPFVPTRHSKMVRGMEVDSIGDQLRRACVQFLGVAPVEVLPFGEQATWAGFRRRRARGGGRRGSDRAVGARLVFAQPVRGPIALGYGAHLGLGLFMPDL